MAELLHRCLCGAVAMGAASMEIFGIQADGNSWCCTAPGVWSLEVTRGGVPSGTGSLCLGTKLSPKAQKILKVMQSRAWFAKQTEHSKYNCECSSITGMCKPRAPGCLFSCNTPCIFLP